MPIPGQINRVNIRPYKSQIGIEILMLDTFCIFHHKSKPFERTYELFPGLYSITTLKQFNDYYVIVSGDIYNIFDLANQFNIETEIIEEIVFELFSRFGKELPNYLEGIFVVVIISKEEVIVFRDPFSLGTVYYGGDIWQDEGTTFILTNTIKNISKFGNLSVNSEVLPRYFTASSTHIGDTFFQNIKSLKPLEILIINLLDHQNFSITYEDWCTKNVNAGESFNTEYVINEVEESLLSSLRSSLKYFSNYSVVNSLSGGVDSSYIQVLLQKLGFNEAITYYYKLFGENIKEYSKDVGSHLGLNHIILGLDPESILENLKEGISISENPYIFMGEIPQNYICDYLKQNEENKVLLISGNSADTLFGFGRPLFELKYLSNPIFSGLFRMFNGSIIRLLSKKDYIRYKTIIKKIRDDHLDEELLYVLFNRNTEEGIIKNAFGIESIFNIYKDDIESINIEGIGLIERIQKWELFEYQIQRQNQTRIELCKKYQIKIIFPYLDKETVRFVTNIPIKKRIRGKTTKYYLKKLLEKYLPSKYIYRKKISTGRKDYLYSEKDDKTSNLIEKIKNEKFEYFNFDYDQIFSDKKYYDLAIKLINFYIWHKLFIEGVEIHDI